MKAMILAAGLGTRLSPLTDSKPKALVEVNGRPLLDLVMDKLVRAGFDEIVVNVHHFAAMMMQYLEKNPRPGIRVEVSDESPLLLDTGGGIVHARWFLDGDEPFLVHNVDILSSVDLKEMMLCHLKSRPLATLAVSRRNSSRYLLFDERMLLQGWENTATGERILKAGTPSALSPLAFSGIHILDPLIFNHLPTGGRFSIIPEYVKLSNSFVLNGYEHDPASWFDLGRPENLALAATYLNETPWRS